MTQLQQALEYINEANYADYFDLMTKILGKNNVLATLRKDYIAYREVPPTFAEKLVIFTKQELTTLSAPDKFLTKFTKPTDFIGRTTELENLHSLLEEGKKSVIVNGLGGIGKTSLARQYAWHYQKHYHHLVWLEQQSSLLLAFTLEQKLTQSISPEKETAETHCQRILQFLAATEGKNLLVIDNYEATETDKSIDFLSQFQDADFAHWRVLFTSREKVNGFTPIALDTLPKEKAIELFLLHCEDKSFDENVLVQILEEIDYHTFTIELLAKTYATNIDLTDLTALLAVLQQKDFDNELVQEMVTTQHHKGEYNLYKHLLLLFDMEKWTAAEQHLLKQFAALPSQPINGKQLLDWLQNDRATYKTALQNLTRKGWLSVKDKHYEMHRLLKMLVQKHLGVMWDEVKILVECVKKEVTEENILANPSTAKYFIEYIRSFLINIDFQKNIIEVSYLHDKLNISLSTLASVYTKQGNYDEAIKLYKETLQIPKDMGIKISPFYIASLNNLALIYINQAKHEESIALYQQALHIHKEYLGVKHPNYSNVLNNLATVYYNQGKYEDAISLLQETLQIIKEVLGEKHITYAISLHNLGTIFYRLKNYKQALNLLEQAYSIFLNTLGDEDSNTKSCKSWLDAAQEALKK